MLELLLNEDNNFAQQLRRLPQRAPFEVNQWLHYWNDADSTAGNLRKLEHWLQRAHKDSAVNAAD